jgi:excisionase family DNA binding protein
VFLASVTEPIDTSTEIGLAIVRILVTFASMESTSRSLRLKAAHRAARMAGKVHPNSRGYGLTADRSALVPEEAALLQEAARRILAGETLGMVVRDWKDRGIPGPRSSYWSVHALRWTLIHPRLAGWITYKGEILGRGTWPAILDDTTSAELRLHLADPTRGKQSYSAPRHLLVGFLRCGRCGGRLNTRPCRNGKYRAYVCQQKPRGCGNLGIRVHQLDALVTREALAKIEELRGRALWWGARQPDPSLAETIERYRNDLHRAGQDYYVEHIIDRKQFLEIRDRLNRALVQERKEIVPLRVDRLLRRFKRRSPLTEWPNLSLEERRAVLAVVVDHVVIHPAPRGTGRFHPERVEIRWFGQDGTPAGATMFPTPPKRRRPDGNYTVAGAANYLAMHPVSVRRLIHSGELEATRPGWAWSITQEVLDAFIATSRVQVGSVASGKSYRDREAATSSDR